MSSANIRETRLAISYKKQSALQTLRPSAGDYFSLTKTNPSLANLALVTETDALDIGKGDEFANNVFKTNWDARIPFEKFTSSQALAFLCAFGFGSVSESNPAAGAYRYTCTPLDPVTDGIELPNFSYVETIRQGGSALFDRASIGNIVASFGMTLSSGPGRQNSKLQSEFVGCGKLADPSGITVPSALTESFLNAGSAGITILGSDYIALKRVVNLDWSWNNNPRLDQGFFPGSGTYQGAAIRGRIENGDRDYSFKFKVRLESTSTELANLVAQTEGTAVLTLQGDLITGSTYHDFTMTLHRVRIKAAVIDDDNGIATVSCELTPLKDSTSGLLTAVVTTNVTGIGS